MTFVIAVDDEVGRHFLHHDPDGGRAVWMFAFRRAADRALPHVDGRSRTARLGFGTPRAFGRFFFALARAARAFALLLLLPPRAAMQRGHWSGVW